MVKRTIDLCKTSQNAAEKLHQDLSDSNKLWHETIRLVVTLSSSALVLTTALAKQLFIPSAAFNELSSFVIGAWLLFFLSIILGIIAEIDDSIFFANIAKKSANMIDLCNERISKGETIAEIEIDNQTIIPGNIYWGIASINLFVIALLSLCSAFLEQMFPTATSLVIFISSGLLLPIINICLLRKRKIV